MDMKKFLQAVDGAEKSTVADSSDMKKFLSVVTEGKGAGNKLTSAENMVYMNTPKQAPVKIDEAPSLLKAYLTLVEDEHINQETNLKKSLADHLEEVKQELVPSSKPRNFVAKNATTSGAGAHKDKKKAEKQGDTKHKAKAIPMDEQGVAGPKDCWPGHKKVGTQPGTGKNAGKRVNDCEKIKKEAIDEGDEQ